MVSIMKINACNVTTRSVEHGPAEVQRQLPQPQQCNQDENELAGKHVAEESQAQ